MNDNSVEKDGLANNSPSSNTADPFDMRKCEEHLPDVDNIDEECSDEEYSDAQDICDEDELLKERHKDLTEEELEVCLHVIVSESAVSPHH